MSDFYNILRQLRESKGLMQKDLAQYLGISPAAYSLYEKGLREPKFDLLEQIADFFNVSIDYLMTGSSTHKTHYSHDDAEELAQFMFDNPEYKVLFDATRKVRKEDIEFVKEMIERLNTRQ